MGLSSLQLDAFFAVASLGGFTLAAKKLALTQSALSQRILNLEAELGTTLFIRESSGLRLTEPGNKLLRYCQSRNLLEEEFLEDLRTDRYGEVKGVLRMAGFSTLNASVLVPLLGRMVKDHPTVQISLIRKELRELPESLTTGESDFIFLTEAFEKPGIECHLLGQEENVLIRSSKGRLSSELFLDHDEDDMTAFEFLRAQGKKKTALKRHFLGGIEAIVEGVKSGIGVAVVPRHLVQGMNGIEIDENFKPLKIPVYLCYYRQVFYTALHQEVIRRILSEVPKVLT